MYTPIGTRPSCAKAWVAAAEAILIPAEAYNVIIDVIDPVNHDAADHAVISLIDKFLSDHQQNPIVSVANTIFPQALYRQHGSPRLFEEYDAVFARFHKSRRWGRYFERMTQLRTVGNEQYRPLLKLIDKLRAQNVARTPFKAAYELPIYQPDMDRNRFRDAPCLSHLSFKRQPDRVLTLTAIYRNQTYISRCLGNLIGLGRLQSFVAKEAGLTVGSLTCISTHAELEPCKKLWGLTEARALVREASSILATIGSAPSPPVLAEIGY